MRQLGLCALLFGISVSACGKTSRDSGGGDTGGNAGSGGHGATGGSSGAAGDDGSAGYSGQLTSGKLDLLFVVDNSISMGDKQAILKDSFTDLVARLANPLCLDESERPTAQQPAGPSEACPLGAQREFAPVRDMHIGIVSSSLGGHGADICSVAMGSEYDPAMEDNAHLIATVRTSGASSYQNLGFLKWDADGQAIPPGESSTAALLDQLQQMVLSVGETGCGFEAPLEALYRFLVDPSPPASVVRDGDRAVLQGIDDALLAQRAAFLRPDSAVMAVVLSDENDCSTVDGGVGWLAAQAGSGFHIPRGTSACHTDPASPCCRSCNTIEASPPAGCTSLGQDSECAKGGHDGDSDPLNLRCFEQKRRFGIDFLYPLDRYVEGMTRATVFDHSGNEVENPLLAARGGHPARHPSLVSIGVIVGVPWQDLARNPQSSTGLELMSASELEHLGRWETLVGVFGGYPPPDDPLLIESPDPRTGENPITGQRLVEPSSIDPAATINGHEFNNPPTGDLQYACIFPLIEPRDCTPGTRACDCTTGDVPLNKPLCNPPGGGAAGTTQYFAKAYPSLRQLELARRMGERAFVASICPQNALDSARADFGYRPALGAMLQRLRQMLP